MPIVFIDGITVFFSTGCCYLILDYYYCHKKANCLFWRGAW